MLCLLSARGKAVGPVGWGASCSRWAHICPKVHHVKAKVGTSQSPSLSKRDRKLSSPSTEAFGDFRACGAAGARVWAVDESGGMLFALVPSACALVICSYAAVYQTHPCNLIFFVFLCLFLYITSSSFLF